MKKILCLIVLLAVYFIASAQYSQNTSILSLSNDTLISIECINPDFNVDLGYSAVRIPMGTIEQQIKDIVRRTIDPPYIKYFDFVFLDSAIVTLNRLYAGKAYSSSITMLENWRDCISFEGTTILKEKCVRFLIQTKTDYEVTVEYALTNEKYDLLIIGQIQIQILKESYGSGKKKIEVPQGSCVMIAMKQPLN